MLMTYKALRNEVMNAMQNKPKNWRNGQFVFNYIDSGYGVARAAQFDKGVDCFYDDTAIEEFIKVCADLIKDMQIDDDREMTDDQYKDILSNVLSNIDPNAFHVSMYISGNILGTTDKYTLNLNAIVYRDNDKLTDLVPVWWEFFVNDEDSDLFSFNDMRKFIK